MAEEAGQTIDDRRQLGAVEPAAQPAAQPLLAHPALHPQAQHLGLERVEQDVRDPPLERQRAVREAVRAADQQDRQVEQLDVRADRGAQALQLVVIAAGGDQDDVQIVAVQALERALGGLGMGGGDAAAERGHDLDLVAARGPDQQDPDPVEGRDARHLGRRRQAELAQHRIAPAALDLHRRQARQRPDAGEQLAILDRQHQHVVGAQRQRMGGDRRGIVGGRDHDRQIAGPGIGLDLGQERHAGLDPGIDQHEIGRAAGERGHRLAVTLAAVQLAAPGAQPRTDEFQRLARALHDDEASR